MRARTARPASRAPIPPGEAEDLEHRAGEEDRVADEAPRRQKAGHQTLAQQQEREAQADHADAEHDRLDPSGGELTDGDRRAAPRRSGWLSTPMTATITELTSIRPALAVSLRDHCDSGRPAPHGARLCAKSYHAMQGCVQTPPGP